eukprot:2876931-Prorocentrum_lima.AAC.1
MSAQGKGPVGQLQGVGDPLEELVDLTPIGDQDGIKARFLIMHQVDIPDMPANGDPTEVLDHNVRGR